MKKLVEIVLCILTLVLLINVISNPQIYIQSVKDALLKCYTTLIPSLMTFMTISGFMFESGVGDTLTSLFYPLFKKVFHLNRVSAKIFLTSIIGGYPSGSKLIDNALKNGQISIQIANALMCYCINASPSYVIVAIGIGVFKNFSLGLTLYFSHLFSTIVFAFLFRPKNIEPDVSFSPLSVGSAFIKAVSQSVSAMLTICGFFLTLSPIITLIDLKISHTTLKTALFLAFDTVTAVYHTATLNGDLAVVLTALSISLGGASILFQCMGMLEGQKLNFKKIILSRISHSLLTAGVSYFIIRVRDVNFSTTIEYASLTQHSFLLCVAFVFCCVCFLFCIGRNKQ